MQTLKMLVFLYQIVDNKIKNECMNFKEKIEIDFLEFFKFGKFDLIRLGQTKEWILKEFPEPDSRFTGEMLKNGFDIWTYGDIEFHFAGQELFLIFSDYFKTLKGGKKLKLNKWILSDISKLNLLYVLTELNIKGIDYKKRTDNLSVTLRLNSGVELTFENINKTDNLSPNEFQMVAFGLVAENPNRWK